MSKHIVEKTAPIECRVPDNIPEIPKFRCIVADPPWQKNMTSRKGYGGAIQHYDLMSIDRLRQLPVGELADDNCHLYCWCLNSNIDEAIDLVKSWGFRYITLFNWIKPKMGCGQYLRGASEPCIFAVKGSLPPKNRTQINWLIDYPTTHSSKPRGFISGVVEKVSPEPYLELLCRKRPASTEKWYCWGNETEGGADIYIPGFPVPKYSFENTEDITDNDSSEKEDAVGREA